MDFKGLVQKRVPKITVFGLKSGQDLENRAAHPHQEFPGVPLPRGFCDILGGCPMTIIFQGDTVTNMCKQS